MKGDHGRGKGHEMDVIAKLSGPVLVGAPVAVPTRARRAATAPELGLPTVLLVDDDDVDVVAITRAFKALRIANPMVTARDGLEALDILRGSNGRDALRAPYLVLLDLHMPRMGGVKFLTELRDDPGLCQTLVFVMTTSARRATACAPTTRTLPAMCRRTERNGPSSTPLRCCTTTGAWCSSRHKAPHPPLQPGIHAFRSPGHLTALPRQPLALQLYFFGCGAG
jgi:CheY-like chemotaxis protein